MKKNNRFFVKFVKAIYLPVLLIVLALWDLRIDFRILFDHITLTAIFFAVKNHPLSFAVLIFSPSLIKKYSE